nr:GDP-mannose 4,6-dehydratase [Dactylosporangium thailandense]
MTVWTDRPVLVTGATGLLGGWLAEALLGLGAHVVALVRDSVPASRFCADGIRDRVDGVRGDVTDQALVERVLTEYEVRTVFHLAAQTIVQIADRNPVSTFDTNIRGTWSVLEACRRSQTVSEIVVASSDKAYGPHNDLPYREDTPLAGRSPYEVSKSCVDLIAQSYAYSYGLPVVVTRCGNFFGGGDLNWSRLVPGAMRDLLAGQSPVIRSDGTMIRDYLYVEDGAAAYVRTAEALMSRRDLAGRAFNFSLQQPLTVLEMLARISAAVGTRIAPTVLGTAATEIPAQHLDSTAARTELGWRPEIGLDEGLRRTADWYRQHLAPPAAAR